MLLSGVNELLWGSKWREDAVGWISSRKPTERFEAITLLRASNDPVIQDSTRSGALPGLFPIGPGPLEWQ